MQLIHHKSGQARNDGRLRPRVHVVLYGEALGYAAGKGHLISILQLAAKGYAAGYGRNAHGKALELAGYVVYRGIALYGGA